MQLCAVVCSCVQLYAAVCSCMQLCAVVCSCMQFLVWPLRTARVLVPPRRSRWSPQESGSDKFLIYVYGEQGKLIFRPFITYYVACAFSNWSCRCKDKRPLKKMRLFRVNLIFLMTFCIIMQWRLKFEWLPAQRSPLWDWAWLTTLTLRLSLITIITIVLVWVWHSLSPQGDWAAETRLIIAYGCSSCWLSWEMGARWIRLERWNLVDWRPGGPGFESRCGNFASELWQFRLPRFANFRRTH